MQEQRKEIRRVAVFKTTTNIALVLLTVMASGIVSTVVNFVYQYYAMVKGVDLDPATATPEVLLMTLAVPFISMLLNLPLTYCAWRFYLLISRSTLKERASIKSFFSPFSSVRHLVSGTAVIFIQLILTMLGSFVLIFPVYLSVCMASFVLADDPDISPFGAFKRSYLLMKGHKMEAFLTVIPIFGVYMLLMVLLSASFLGTLLSSVAQAVFYIALALIYNKLSGYKAEAPEEENNGTGSF